MASEKNFENRVKTFLKEQGCWYLKYWGGAAYTKSGIPDLLVCCHGFFLGVEIKAPNGRPSELQLHNLREIDKANGFGVLLYPDQFDTFKGLIYAMRAFDSTRIDLFYGMLKKRWSDAGKSQQN